MFDQIGAQRVRLGLFIGFLIGALIVAFTSMAVLSGWLFAVALYYLHLNIEHSGVAVSSEKSEKAEGEDAKE